MKNPKKWDKISIALLFFNQASEKIVGAFAIDLSFFIFSVVSSLTIAKAPYDLCD